MRYCSPEFSAQQPSSVTADKADGSARSDAAMRGGLRGALTTPASAPIMHHLSCMRPADDAGLDLGLPHLPPLSIIGSEPLRPGFDGGCFSPPAAPPRHSPSSSASAFSPPMRALRMTVPTAGAGGTSTAGLMLDEVGWPAPLPYGPCTSPGQRLLHTRVHSTDGAACPQSLPLPHLPAGQLRLQQSVARGNPQAGDVYPVAGAGAISSGCDDIRRWTVPHCCEHVGAQPVAMRRSLQPYGPRPLQHHHQQWQRHSQLYPQQQAYARHLSPQQQQQQQQQMPQLVLLGKRPHPGAELGGAAELEDDEVSEDECGGGDYVRWAHGPHIAPRGPWRGPAAPLQQQQMPQQLMLLAARPEYAQPLARAATASPHPQLGQQLPIDFESPRGRIVSAIPVVMAQRAPDGAALPPLVLPSPEGLPSMQQQQHWHQDQYARQQQRLLQQQHLQQVALAQHQQAQQRQLQEYQAWQARQPALQSVAPQWQVPQDVLQPSRQLQGPQQRQAAGPASSACAPMPLPNIFDDVPLDVDLGFDLALEHELGQDGMGEAGSEAAAGEPVITLEAGLAAMGCAEDLPGGTTGAALAWAQSYGAARRGSLADSHSPPAGSSSPQTAQAVMAAAATLATAAPRTTGAGRSSSTGSRPEQQVAPPSNGCAAAANLETASAGGVVACTHAASGGRGGSIGLASSDLGRDAAPAQQGMMTGPQPTPASIPSPKRPTKMKSLLELAAQLPDVDPYPRARILNPHLAGALQPSHGDAQKPGLESCDSSAAGGCGETARTMTTPAAGGRNFGV